MRRNYKFGIIMFLLFTLLLSPLCVVATEVEETVETEELLETTIEVETKQIELKEVEGVKGFYEDSTLLMSYDSEEFKEFENYIIQSVKEEFREGLNQIKTSKITKDHIEMESWGDFLYKYLGKTSIDMTSENILINKGNYIYSIKGSKVAKEWLEGNIIPEIVGNMKRDSADYPAEWYRLKLNQNERWQDVGTLNLSDKSKLELISAEYPMSQDSSTYLVYNTGSVYGVMLNPKYVEILRGYNNELEFVLPVESDVPATVNTLAHIVYLKNLEGATIEDKVFSDMGLYEGLAIDLVTKELIDTSDLSTNKETLRFKDFNLKEEDLILVSLEDSTVLVQSIYLECFNWGGKEYNTGTWVDFSSLLLGNSNSAVFSGGNIDIRTYQDNGDILNTKIGRRNPFLLFASVNNLPFDRLIKWAYSDISVGEMSEEQKENMVDTIKDMMYSQGRKDEYKLYIKEAGASKTSFLVVGVLVVVIVSIGAIFVLMRNKNNEANKDNQIDFSDLLYEENNEHIDTGDDDNLFK